MNFTIVTPSLRQLDHLAGCIASVADQEGVTLEHIVMDGGSEGFGEFSRKMQARWPERPNYRRVMVSQTDLGMYDAINQGLKRGTGEICAYLNCDEQYLPGALEKILRVFRAHARAEICHGGFLVVDSRGGLVTIQKPVRLIWAHVATSHLPNFSCATFFRRSLLEKEHAWFDASYQACADALWNMERLRVGTPTVRISTCVSAFQQTGTNRGLSPAGLAEREKIARQAPSWVQRARPLWTGIHRVLKFCVGGYLPKKIAYSLWQKGDETSRILHGPFWANGIWWERLKT